MSDYGDEFVTIEKINICQVTYERRTKKNPGEWTKHGSNANIKVNGKWSDINQRTWEVWCNPTYNDY